MAISDTDNNTHDPEPSLNNTERQSASSETNAESAVEHTTADHRRCHTEYAQFQI